MKKTILLLCALLALSVPALALAVEGEAEVPALEAPSPEGWPTEYEESAVPDDAPTDVPPLFLTIPEDEPVLPEADLPTLEKPFSIVTATPTSVDNETLLFYLEQFNSLLMIQVAVAVAAVIATMISIFSREWFK